MIPRCGPSTPACGGWGLDHVDLYLLHWPVPSDFDATVAAYRGPEELVAQGRVRAIGVSNFGASDLTALLDRIGLVPAANQIELHPFFTPRLRPALEPGDRSLATVSALISAGRVEQLPFHLNRAMNNGLTQAEASEVLTHLAFYAGWPKVFSALPVAREVFEARTEQ